MVDPRDFEHEPHRPPPGSRIGAPVCSPAFADTGKAGLVLPSVHERAPSKRRSLGLNSRCRLGAFVSRQRLGHAHVFCPSYRPGALTMTCSSLGGSQPVFNTQGRLNRSENYQQPVHSLQVRLPNSLFMYHESLKMSITCSLRETW